MMNELTLLKNHFGYDSFRPGQETVITAITSGRDVLAVMPTGAGKSICYQIPALMLPGLSIVVSPLISLMRDQVEALDEAGVPAAYLNSSLSPAEYGRTMHRLRQGELKLLYLAPERLDKLSTQLLDDFFTDKSSAAGISLVVVDEAHCVSQWGHDFRPSYFVIVDFVDTIKMRLGKRPVLAAFTATATGEVQTDIISALHLSDPLHLVNGFDRPNLYFAVEKVQGKREKNAALLELLAQYSGSRNTVQSGIIYCATRKAVEELSDMLCERGFPATRYHAGLGDDERKRNQDDFIYDRCPLIVATNAFGMGIDKSNVSFVIHYNMPKNIESYYQEAGRAGRDGESANCILLYSPGDVSINEFLIKNNTEDASGEYDSELIQHNLYLLRQMTLYATSTECLRKKLLAYFGESFADNCNNCSACNTETIPTDVSIDAKKIVSCVYRVAQARKQCGKSMILDILQGKSTSRIREQGFENLSTWGIMKDANTERIRFVMDYLIEKDYLYIEGTKYPLLRLGPEYKEVFITDYTLILKIPVAHEKHTYYYNTDTDITNSGITNTGITNANTSNASIAYDENLLAELKKLRTKFAKEAGMPAYIIFSDATLKDMCRKLPQTDAAFLNVSGVGKSKLQKYGAAFMDIINEYKA
ncbi:MAG: DNA helicase RecQ [Spirochaetaceae bacterium]|jgi:ATP-dependent DNA helicase RecQ|nr:DNA helicase RecQ [Spirochaetaceae bacterium]